MGLRDYKRQHTETKNNHEKLTQGDLYEDDALISPLRPLQNTDRDEAPNIRQSYNFDTQLDS